jgi:hypothetical protein
VDQGKSPGTGLCYAEDGLPNLAVNRVGFLLLGVGHLFHAADSRVRNLVVIWRAQGGMMANDEEIRYGILPNNV